MSKPTLISLTRKKIQDFFTVTKPQDRSRITKLFAFTSLATALIAAGYNYKTNYKVWAETEGDLAHLLRRQQAQNEITQVQRT